MREKNRSPPVNLKWKRNGQKDHSLLNSFPAVFKRKPESVVYHECREPFNDHLY